MASEYGWSFRDIMYNTYPEDFFLLQRQIRMRTIDDYLMQASLIANPHKEKADAEEFIETLLDQRRFYRGGDEAAAQTDFAALDALKDQLKNDGSGIKVK